MYEVAPFSFADQSVIVLSVYAVKPPGVLLEQLLAIAFRAYLGNDTGKGTSKLRLDAPIFLCPTPHC